MTHPTTPHLPTHADELERMAERATLRDHNESPIVEAIRQAPSARPFVGALRVLVGKLTAEGSRAPRGSIVTALLRDSDLDVVDKLAMLREFLPGEDGYTWRMSERGHLAARLAGARDGVSAILRDVAHKGGAPTLDLLFTWLDDERRLNPGKASIADVAEALLMMRAEIEPDAVLNAAAASRDMSAFGVVHHVSAAHPREGFVFARQRIEEGRPFGAAIALGGIARSEGTHDEVRELASAIAADPVSHHARVPALRVLLSLAPIAPATWEVLETLPQEHRRLLAYPVARTARDGRLEALNVLEIWARQTPVSDGFDPEVIEALGECLRIREPPDNMKWQPHDVATRVLDDLREARSRGIRPSAIARALEVAFYERSDAECAALGLTEFAMEVAGSDAASRKMLMYVVSWEGSRDKQWSARLLGRIAEVAGVAEKDEYICVLMLGDGARDPWCKAAAARLAAGGGEAQRAFGETIWA